MARRAAAEWRSPSTDALSLKRLIRQRLWAISTWSGRTLWPPTLLIATSLRSIRVFLCHFGDEHHFRRPADGQAVPLQRTEPQPRTTRASCRFHCRSRESTGQSSRSTSRSQVPILTTVRRSRRSLRRALRDASWPGGAGTGRAGGVQRQAATS